MQYHSKINNFYFYFPFLFFSFVDFFSSVCFFVFICKWKTIMPVFRKEQQSLFVWDLGNGKWLIPQDVQCFQLHALRSLWSGWELTLWRPGTGQPLTRLLQTSWKGIQRNAALVIAKGTDLWEKIETTLITSGSCGMWWDLPIMQVEKKENFWYWLLHESWFLIWGS